MSPFHSLLSFIFCFLALISNGCLAQLGLEGSSLWTSLEQQQPHRLKARTSCSINRLTAQEPRINYEFEAGVSEFWDQTGNEFSCAGVAVVRNVIQPKGLLLPHYNDAPQLMYILQGNGVHGTVISGCPETFESELQPSGSDQELLNDHHQKVRQFRQGDVLVLPAGVTLWFYNNGQEPVIAVSLFDTSNEDNQLDEKYRIFFLAGNYPILRRRANQKMEAGTTPKEGGFSNIFDGFDDEILANSFKVDTNAARKLKGPGDHRGRIVRAERLDVIVPPQTEEQEQSGRGNGLEESLCAVRLHESIDQPNRADVYNPSGGRITTLNSKKLPILSWIDLSAERGVLYKNAVLAPRWNLNAHSIIYITRGSSRLQVAGHTGRLLFDGEVRQGQLIVVPQNHVMLKKAGDQGCEWIAFKTKDNAMTSQLSGRVSTIRAMPVEVLMNSYGISLEDARNLKYNGDEYELISPRSRDKRGQSQVNMISSVM